MKTYKYIFLDLDDTIWDFRTNAKYSLENTFDELLLNRYFNSFDHFFDIYIKRNAELWDMYGRCEITKDQLMLERFSFPLSQVGVTDTSDLALEIGRNYLEMLPHKKALMPYAREVLEYLFSKYPLTIISNGFEEVQYKKLNSSQLSDYFAHVVLSEKAGALKPDKRIFEYAMKLNRADPSEILMIGDSLEADICGAQKAGIDQVYLNPRKNKIHCDIQPTYHIESLKEMFEIV